MENESPQTLTNGQNVSAEDRLESWKEISAYLKRDIRTLRRWEKNEGLPVHRHMHDKLPSVYAFKSEIDAWWASRLPSLETSTKREKVSRLKSAWVALVAVVVIAAAGWGIWKWIPHQQSLPFHKRDWILVTAFENRTGEPVLNGTVEYALERELSNSRFVNVVPRERINDTLRLMKRPLDSSLDRAVGREVCLRDGGIRALITGRVEKLGDTYVLSAALVEPSSGATVASFSQEAHGQAEVADAVRRLSNRVRQTLGEDLAEIRRSNQKLERVSTPSLAALQLYSRAAAMVNHSQWEEATGLVRQALEDDPNFASAHVLMAFCLRNTGKEQEAAVHFRRAYELADTATPRERYFIRGCYYWYLNDIEKAQQAFETLLDLYPDHYWGVKNLIASSVRLGRSSDAVPYVVRYAQARPNDFEANFDAAFSLATWRDDDRQAESYLERARALVSQTQVPPWSASWVNLFPVYVAWQKGDVRASLQELNKKVRATRAGEDANPYESWQAASMYLALGKPHVADEAMQPLADAPKWQHQFALIPIVEGNEQEFRRRLRFDYPSYRAVILLARGSRLSAAEKMFSDPEAARTVFGPSSATSWKGLADGALAFARGDTRKGTAILQKSLAEFRPWPNPYYFLTVETLADSLERRGQTTEALDLLNEAALEKNASAFHGGAAFWMRIDLKRAQLYRRLGKHQEAERIGRELNGLLAVADPDFPLLRELRALEHTPSHR